MGECMMMCSRSCARGCVRVRCSVVNYIHSLTVSQCLGVLMCLLFIQCPPTYFPLEPLCSCRVLSSLWDRLELNPDGSGVCNYFVPEGGMPSAVHTVAHPHRFADVLVAAVTMALGRRGLLSLLPPSRWSLLLKHSTSGAAPPLHTRPPARSHTHWHIHTDKHA